MTGTRVGGTAEHVVVVGAGLAGLAAARRLGHAGVDVTVARGPRPGRRPHRGRHHRTTGPRSSSAASGSAPTQNRMYELVDELGLETFPTYNDGQHVILLGGRTEPDGLEPRGGAAS